MTQEPDLLKMLATAESAEMAGEWADGEHIDIFTPIRVRLLIERVVMAEDKLARVRELAEACEKHDYPRGMHRFEVAKRIRRALDGESND